MELANLLIQIKKLSRDERIYLMREILKDDSISITDALVAQISNLEQFKRDAKHDIVKVAEAGMELGEREMRRLTKIKGNTRKKTDTFYMSMIRCLLDAGAYKGTEYGKQIEGADFSTIDEDWYGWAWKPKTTREKISDE
jgi:hypothetical protein